MVKGVDRGSEGPGFESHGWQMFFNFFSSTFFKVSRVRGSIPASGAIFWHPISEKMLKRRNNNENNKTLVYSHENKEKTQFDEFLTNTLQICW